MVLKDSVYYTYPHAGWWQGKEAIARKMSLDALYWSRHDAFDAAKANPETEGKYMDECSIYVQEINRRKGS